MVVTAGFTDGCLDGPFIYFKVEEEDHESRVGCLLPLTPHVVAWQTGRGKWICVMKVNGGQLARSYTLYCIPRFLAMYLDQLVVPHFQITKLVII